MASSINDSFTCKAKIENYQNKQGQEKLAVGVKVKEFSLPEYLYIIYRPNDSVNYHVAYFDGTNWNGG